MDTMDNTKKRIQEVAQGYDKLAWEYDKGYQDNFSKAEEYVLGNFLSRLVDMGAGGNILDMGCGTGLLLDLLKYSDNIKERYFGYDISDEMLKVARVKHPLDETRINRYMKCSHEEWMPEACEDIEFAFSLFGSPSYSDLHSFLKLVRDLRENSQYEQTGFFMFYGNTPRCGVEGYQVTTLIQLQEAAAYILGPNVEVFPWVCTKPTTLKHNPKLECIDILKSELDNPDYNTKYNYYSILAYGPQVSRHIGIR
jgi:SAM-dependent methyltransferase